MTPQWRNICFLGLASLLILVAAVSVGSIDLWQLNRVDPEKFERIGSTILWQLRLPRVLSAFMVGASLALSGVLCQQSLQNSLADPYLLGISSGATLGAIFSMGLIGTELSTPILAFIGGLSGLGITLLISGRNRWLHPPTLVLAGAIASFFLSALGLLLLTFVEAPTLPGIVFWLGGDLSLADFSTLVVVGLGALPAILILFFFAPDLALLEGGEEEARSLGVNTRRATFLALLSAALASATSVSKVGMIGFIGLMVPHASKVLIGFSPRLHALFCFFLGGCLLTLSDLLARTLSPQTELPVGVLTSLIGCPFLIWLLRRNSLV